MARAATAGAFRSVDFRRLQSLSFTKAIPIFWPRPAKLKPATVIIVSTVLVSCSRKYFSTLPNNFYGPFLCCTGRQLDLADDETLVLIRQKCSGEPQEEKHHGHHEDAIQEQIPFRLLNEPPTIRSNNALARSNARLK